MRLLCAIVFLVGLALAGADRAGALLPGRDIGRWPLYEPASGAAAAHARLSERDAPLRVMVDLGVAGAWKASDGQAAVRLTVTSGGATVLARDMDFAGVQPRDANIQTRERSFVDTAGVLDRLAPGDYAFAASPGGAVSGSLRRVDLVLRHEWAGADPRYRPAGYALMALGAVGFGLALRRGGGHGNPNSRPPPPRWGRGGA